MEKPKQAQLSWAIIVMAWNASTHNRRGDTERCLKLIKLLLTSHRRSRHLRQWIFTLFSKAFIVHHMQVVKHGKVDSPFWRWFIRNESRGQSFSSESHQPWWRVSCYCEERERQGEGRKKSVSLHFAFPALELCTLTMSWKGTSVWFGLGIENVTTARQRALSTGNKEHVFRNITMNLQPLYSSQKL